jgi:hypothetical protein
MILLYPLLKSSTCIELISRSKNPVTQSLKPWTVSKILVLRNNQNSVHKITDWCMVCLEVLKSVFHVAWPSPHKYAIAFAPTVWSSSPLLCSNRKDVKIQQTVIAYLCREIPIVADLITSCLSSLYHGSWYTISSIGASEEVIFRVQLFWFR